MLCAEQSEDFRSTALESVVTVEEEDEQEEDDDELPPTALLALCDANADEEDAVGPELKRRRQSSRVPKMRGVHRAHGRTVQDYVASVGWENFYIQTKSSRSISDAIDWHILLVHVKQFAKAQKRKGFGFDEAVWSAMSEAVRLRTEEGKSMPVLKFCSFISYQNTKIALPLTPNLDRSLRQRQEIMDLRAAGASLAEVLARKGQMAAAAKEQRTRMIAERRAAKLNIGKSQPNEVSAPMKRRLLKAIKEHVTALHCSLQTRCLPEGLDALFYNEESSRSAFVYAVLGQSSTQEVICTGPLRTEVSAALGDLRLLEKVLATRGAKAAVIQAHELDVQVMTARFCEISS